MPTAPLKKRRAKTSLKDVALEVGCSVAVVSTVLNATKGCSVVSDALRKRVTEVAKQLNYRANFASQSLVRGRTNTLGIFNPPMPHTGMGHFYDGRMLQGIEDACRDEQFDLLLVNVAGQQQGSACVRKLEENRVDGLLVFRSDICPDVQKELEPYAHLVILLDTANPHPKFQTVVYDNAGAIYEAVKHLAKLGHTRIGFLGPCLSELQLPWIKRCEGYRQAVSDLGLPLDDRLIFDHDKLTVPLAESDEYCQFEGYQGMKYMLELGADRPTAVVAYNDLVAISAYQACDENQIKIPQQMSIIGLGDEPERCTFVKPRLTSLSHPLVEMGSAAAKLLIQRIRENKTTAEVQDVGVFKSVLHHRDSTSPPQIDM